MTGNGRDPGLYGPGSEGWRLDREAMLLLGAGPRSLLMQIAHPLVAEGVDQHSAFRADPWLRLQGTLRSILRIVYGTTPAARAEIRRLNALHRGIGGPVRDPGARRAHGDRYSARDPELALWVHATLVDSTIESYDAWLEPHDRPARARFYAETRPIARAFGIPDAILPPDIDAFDEYMARMLAPDGPIHVSPTAREIGRTILNPPLGPVIPPLGWLPSPAYAWTLWPAVGLLPPRLREGFGLRWGPLERAVSGWLVAGWRGWRPLVPSGLRWVAQARAADRRVESR
ncbi:MAG TPA: oxygenase MpaB family protein [Candidatus Limnocylindrales bacterium]|nr:oxygenase MpaB family protein [Candidatus Limnocylindrales bacterium]